MKRLLILIALTLTCWASVPHAQVPRPTYLSPIDGSGTDADPFRSRCLDIAGKGNIDLRPWGINRFLCASNALPTNMTGVGQLGSSLLDNLTPARKTALEALLGKSVSASNVREVIIELLQSRLQAGRDGKLKIWLGEATPVYEQTAGIPFRDNGLFADTSFAVVAVATVTATAITRVPARVLAALVAVVLSLTNQPAWATTLTTETFTATDGNLDGCQARGCTHSHTEISGTPWTITSNQATASGNATGVSRMETPLDTVNHRASLTVVNVTTGGGGTNATCSVLIRKENNATLTFYRNTAVIRNAGELNETQLSKVVAGTITVLDNNNTDWAANDVLFVSADGTTILGGTNNVLLLSITDVEITTGTYVGLRYFADTSSGACTVDNLGAQDISTGRNRGVVLF